MGMFPSLSALVQRYESGGNYAATNPTSTASGAYQFTNPTWNQYASQIGVDTSQYPTAASAPPAVQDAVFQQAVAQRGLGDWTCPGCNPALTSYLASNPSDANLPVFAGGTSPGTTGSTADPNSPAPQPTGTCYGYDPSTGAYTVPTPCDPATGNTQTSPTPAGDGLLTPLWELMQRASIFTLGMCLLMIALIAMLWKGKTIAVNVGHLQAPASATG